MNRSSFARSLIATAAGALALGLGGAAAQAQPYGQYAAPPPGAGYVTCKQEAGSRSLLGALVGGGLGAVVGSHMAANHHRSDGGLVGAGVGALIGAGVGHSSANCAPNGYAPPPPPPPPQAYAPPPPPPPPVYEGAYRDGPPRWAYGHHGRRYRIADAPVGADGCTLAESPIYLPDGRVQKRFVRVCMDADGRYQVVD
jgi:hypothetical protein